MRLTIFLLIASLFFACSKNNNSQSEDTPSAEKSSQYASVRLEKRIPGDPLDHLPDNIEILTRFGERADISPDNKRNDRTDLDLVTCAWSRMAKSL
jgi:hypothetical protein